MPDSDPDVDSAGFERSPQENVAPTDTWDYFLPDTSPESSQSETYSTRLSPPVAAEVEALRDRHNLSKANAIALLVQLGLGHIGTVSDINQVAVSMEHTTDRLSELESTVTQLEHQIRTMTEPDGDASHGSVDGGRPDRNSDSDDSPSDNDTHGIADDPDGLF
jgi:hypothetical protein